MSIVYLIGYLISADCKGILPPNDVRCLCYIESCGWEVGVLMH